MHTDFQKRSSWLLLNDKRNQVYLKYKQELRSCSRANTGDQQRERKQKTEEDVLFDLGTEE